jgi:excisionase family DNA binding protein
MLKTQGAVDLRPAALTVPDAEDYSGLGKSKLYEEAAAGKITMVKAGGRTLILRESLDAYLANCPRLHKTEAA